MTKYPASMVEPTIAAYSIGVDMGVLRTQIRSGIPRQRRRHRTMPQKFTFSFVIKINDLDVWQEWVNDFAYEWFEINIMSYLTNNGTDGKACSPHTVRFISDIALSAFDYDHFNVTVNAEMAPMRVK